MENLLIGGFVVSLVGLAFGCDRLVLFGGFEMLTGAIIDLTKSLNGI